MVLPTRVGPRRRDRKINKDNHSGTKYPPPNPTYVGVTERMDPLDQTLHLFLYMTL